MLRVEGVTLSLKEPDSRLSRKAASMLGIPANAILRMEVLRRAVDARGEEPRLTYTLLVEVKNQAQVLRHTRNCRVSVYTEETYTLPTPVPSPDTPPVVVGAGPAGLFCALALAYAGTRPILLERGFSVERRKQDVERFWTEGILLPCSNVQFGEGGAGAFSDGKLHTGTRNRRYRFILETLVRHGAPESILTDAKPHVGTDRLYETLIHLRQELIRLGCDIRFGTRLTGLCLEKGRLAALEVTTEEGVSEEGVYRLPTQKAALALGNSARDTFAILYQNGVRMEPKPLAVGVRIEHRQADIDIAQYGRQAGHPRLGAASYKLSCHPETGRGVFSFCVCPGGQVIATASEPGHTVVNGMSLYARDGENCNGGLLVSVAPSDFPGTGPLAGIAFQRAIEARAYQAGGGKYAAPAQRVGDFLERRPSSRPGRVYPTYRPGVRWQNLWDVLPDFVCESLAQALPLLDRKLSGYAHPDAVLTAPETRSSCPLRISRGEMGEANIPGLYPCGEGAGYAGGILSAAADGLATAEHMLDSF